MSALVLLSTAAKLQRADFASRGYLHIAELVGDRLAGGSAEARAGPVYLTKTGLQEGVGRVLDEPIIETCFDEAAWRSSDPKRALSLSRSACFGVDVSSWVRRARSSTRRCLLKAAVAMSAYPLDCSSIQTSYLSLSLETR